MWIELTTYDEISIGYQDFQKGVPVEVSEERGKSLIATKDFRKTTAPKKAEKENK